MSRAAPAGSPSRSSPRSSSSTATPLSRRVATSFARACRFRARSPSRTCCLRRRRSRSSSDRSGRRRGGNTTGSCSWRSFWRWAHLSSSSIAVAASSAFFRRPSSSVSSKVIPCGSKESGRPVTILFTDLRGSTSLAERLTPEQTIAAVNAYLRVMARCVLDNGGILDKFTGDGVMAIFGAMSDPTNGALAAARAALAMRASIAQLNVARAARGDVVVQFGMGLHTGDVVVGAVGLPERSQYDAIGDAVNTASRMETLTKEFQVDSILSKDTAERLRADGVALRALGEAHVKGKANAIEVFTLS